MLVNVSLLAFVSFPEGVSDGITNAAAVAENRPHYSFRVSGDVAWWNTMTYKDEDRICFPFQKFIFFPAVFL